VTVSPTWTVFCEGAVCGAWIAEEPTPAEARKMARRNGWLLRPKKAGGDLCPLCRVRLVKP
jgi:hypothetical protein